MKPKGLSFCKECEVGNFGNVDEGLNIIIARCLKCEEVYGSEIAGEMELKVSNGKVGTPKEKEVN